MPPGPVAALWREPRAVRTDLPGASGMPRKQRVVRHLEEMAETSAWMVELAMRAFRDRDAGGCR